MLRSAVTCVIQDSAVVWRARAMKYNYYACMHMLCVCERVQLGWVRLYTGRRDQMMLWRVG